MQFPFLLSRPPTTPCFRRDRLDSAILTQVRTSLSRRKQYGLHVRYRDRVGIFLYGNKNSL